jgi:hypothetical protein
MKENRFYAGLGRGTFLQIGLLLLVFVPFLVLAFRALDMARSTGFIAYCMIPLLYVIPWLTGLRLKKAVRDASTARVLGPEAGELCDSWLTSAQWSAYVVMAIIVLFSRFPIVR